MTGGRSDETGLARLYRAYAAETPPPALDARILAAARAQAPMTGRRRGFSRWAVPLSLAATMLLGVGVALRLWERTEVTPVSAPQAPSILMERADADRTRDAAPARRAEAPGHERAPPSERHATDAGPAVLAFAKKPDGVRADIVSVTASGGPGAYRFTVGVRSSETGCEQYADWWEVVSTDGKLLYRRVLLHSHVDEQPFMRSGGPVPIERDTIVWVRAHMNTAGYGGVAFRGSVAQGFAPAALAPDFAAALATQPPLPDGCAF